jgi:hypothetical protein
LKENTIQSKPEYIIVGKTMEKVPGKLFRLSTFHPRNPRVVHPWAHSHKSGNRLLSSSVIGRK